MYQITKDSIFETYGEGWKLRPSSGIAFEKDTRHVVYNTSDLFYSTKGVTKVDKDVLYAPQWKDKRLQPGTVVAMRAWTADTWYFLVTQREYNIEKCESTLCTGNGLAGAIV